MSRCFVKWYGIKGFIHKSKFYYAGMFWWKTSKKQVYLSTNLCKIIKPLTLNVTDSHSSLHSWNVYSWLICNLNWQRYWCDSHHFYPHCEPRAVTYLWQWPVSVMKRLVISLIKYWYMYHHKSNINARQMQMMDSRGLFKNWTMKWQKLGWYQNLMFICMSWLWHISISFSWISQTI